MSDSRHTDFFGILTILFVGLKLTGCIGWSWWWVTSPVWIPLIIFLFIAMLLGLVEYFKGVRK